MTVEFTLVQDYPTGLDHLWAAFGRPDYAMRKYQALGSSAVHLRRFEATAQAIEVELERDAPVDRSALPLWARTLVGRRQTLRHHTVWRRTGPSQVSAELDISPAGLPVHAQAVGVIGEPAPATTRMVLTWQVNSVLGARVERLFARQLRAALNADHAFTVGDLREGAAAGSLQRANAP